MGLHYASLSSFIFEIFCNLKKCTIRISHFPVIVVRNIIQGLTVNFSEIQYAVLFCVLFFSGKFLVGSSCVFYVAFSSGNAY